MIDPSKVEMVFPTLLSAVRSRGKKTRANWTNSIRADWSDSNFSRRCLLDRNAFDHTCRHAVALDEMMPDRRQYMDRDQRQQDVGEEDMLVLVEGCSRLVGRGELRHAEQAEPVGIIRLARPGMRPAKHGDQERAAIQRAMADARGNALPPRRTR